MTGNRRHVKSLGAYLLLFAILMTSFGSLTASALGSYVNGSSSLYRTDLNDIKNYLTATTYDEYRNEIYKGEFSKLDKGGYYGDNPENSIIPLDVESFELTSGDAKTVNDLAEDKAPVLISGSNSIVSWKVDLPKDTIYCLRIEYYSGYFDYSESDGETESKDDKMAEQPYLSKGSAAERYVLIDGTVPYKEARSIEFDLVWQDVYTVVDENGTPVLKDGKKQMYTTSDEKFLEFIRNSENHSSDSDRLFVRDINGNELKPDKELVETWITKDLHDSTGYYNEPLAFFFSKGEHTVSLQAVREPLAIKSISLVPFEENISYEEYLKKYSNKKDYTGDESVKIQAEYPTFTSGNTIYALNDRSSSYSEPQDAALIRLNEIGGDKWQYVGQWIEWEITVPEEGFYSIVPRSQQNWYSGIYVSRKIYIDGKIPFEEAGNLRFNYSSDWQTQGLNNGGDPFKFYLKKGTSTIRLEVVLGDMSSVLSTVENSLSQINGYYRKILMITGPDADEYRDYGFDKLIPDVVKGLGEQAKILTEVSAELTRLTGEKGEHSSTLDRVALVCERMSTEPDKIASQMSTLKDYSASLGSWLSSTQNQPLDIDYISIQAVGSDAPKAEPGFFGTLIYEIQKFYKSFFSDYNSLGATGENIASESDVDVEVWTATSRDQAQIIRSLIDDDFTPNHSGINVELKLVAGGTLLPATLAGTGPDVYMGAGQGDPVNYAIRSAVLSLNTKTGNTAIGYDFTDLKKSQWYDKEKYPEFYELIESETVKDFESVSDWFAPQSLVPVTLYGETYALPMTMSFSMMFYRKDIFAELDIDIPNTWDDFYDIIYSLQSNSLDIGFPQGTGGSMVMMYQQNEPLYDEGNYDYYLELLQRYYYEGDFDKISDKDLKKLNKDLADKGLTYETYDDDNNLVTRPKTDGMTINLDSDISLATFKDVCQFFTMYDFPITFDFANRFRSGEMPLGIMDYTAYNTLIVFAPEINGLWEFTPLPGTANELTQEINNSTIGGISTIMLMNSVSKDEAAAFGSWAFMQWYLNKDIQSAYGNEMVALLGPSAKQPTANMEALEDMAWSTEESKNLLAQFNAVVCTPEYPGSYIIGRYTTFAFLDVVNNSADPIEEMQSQITDINVELTRKREEFGLPTSDSIKEMLNVVKEKYPNWNKEGGKS